jgi:hypothetical protein
MNWREFAGAIAAAMMVACAAEPTRPPAGEVTAPTGEKPAAAPTPAVSPPVAATPEPAPVVAEAPEPAPVVAQAPTAADDKEPAAKESPQSAKLAGPVTVTAPSVTATAAELAVAFGADGTDVTIKVWGVDGLKISKSSAPTAPMAVRRGQVVKIAVDYTSPAGASNLAIKVSGTFAGKEQAKTQSFTVGAATAKPDAPAKTDKDGRPIKVMKAQ